MSQSKRKKVAEVFPQFVEIADPRVTARCDHPLINIIVISVCAVLCGAEAVVEIEEFGEQRRQWFEKFLDLTNGIPSHDTITRVFSLMAPRVFEEAFYNWVKETFAAYTKLKRLSIDGKSVNGTKKSFTAGNRALLLVNVYSHELGLVLCQTRAKSSGSGESSGALEMLKLIDPEGALISVDAGLSTRRVTQEIRAQKADYIVPIKGNQRPSVKEIKQLFRQATSKQKERNLAETSEKIHGRKEVRQCCVLPCGSASEMFKKQWRDVRTIGFIRRKRSTKDTRFTVQQTDSDGKQFYRLNKSKIKTSEQLVYFVSSKKLKAKEAMHMLREHWEIENKLHWSLDVSFGEDRCRVREKTAAQNLALVRKIAFNIIQADTTKGSKKVKMKRAAWNPQYLETLLFEF